MKFPISIRLDGSDPSVFETAAAPGEPAVPGSFAFANRDPDSFSAKERQAFACGWLGTESFGRCSLVTIGEIDEAAFAALVERLARHFVAHYGAPDLAAALPAAREEADYAAALCEHKRHSLLAVERAWSEAGIAERFRVVTPARSPDHARIWELVDEGEAPEGGS